MWGISVSVNVCVCVSVFHVYVYECICVCVWGVFVCVCLWSLYVHVCVYKCMYMYEVYLYICVCVYVCVCICLSASFFWLEWILGTRQDLSPEVPLLRQLPTTRSLWRGLLQKPETDAECVWSTASLWGCPLSLSTAGVVLLTEIAWTEAPAQLELSFVTYGKWTGLVIFSCIKYW